jgi:hypothetical protein
VYPKAATVTPCLLPMADRYTGPAAHSWLYGPLAAMKCALNGAIQAIRLAGVGSEIRSVVDEHVFHLVSAKRPPVQSSPIRDGSLVDLRIEADHRAWRMLERRQSSWRVEVSTLPLVPGIDCSYLMVHLYSSSIVLTPPRAFLNSFTIWVLQ